MKGPIVDGRECTAMEAQAYVAAFVHHVGHFDSPGFSNGRPHTLADDVVSTAAAKGRAAVRWWRLAHGENGE